MATSMGENCLVKSVDCFSILIWAAILKLFLLLELAL